MTIIFIQQSLLRWWKCDTPQGNDYTTTYVQAVLHKSRTFYLIEFTEVGQSFDQLHLLLIMMILHTAAIGQISVVLFDIGVLSTILYHTWNIIRQQRSQEGYSTSFSALFIRQGTVLSPILLGRFLFQLRKAAERTDNLEHTDDSLESHQLTSFRAADNLNLNHGHTTTVFTDLPLSFASGDSDTLPSITRSARIVQEKSVV
ncbi:hypothetical protein Clacol_010150 [Clathrus columnatus]|uniref:Uncharacterized protein n=1 Tax=Clathrus columnatus TaxID=1419009 RepID=A0AAV5AMG0_9AGAM|nr:hypothetical protein Clacol_010150 [Clathrus columnatus]